MSAFKLLKIGDVIELKKDHHIFYELPKQFNNGNSITIGRTYFLSKPLEKGDEGYDPDFLQKAYEKQQAPDYKGTKGIIGTPSKIIDSFDTNFLIGTYIVIFTYFGGGGNGFPDGHRVFCRKLNGIDIIDLEISFYETGCFDTMITGLEPISQYGKLKYSII